MTKIFKSIKNFGDRFDKKMQRFSFCHPVVAFFAMFIGMPIMLLITVCICTTIITFPVAFIMGWL